MSGALTCITCSVAFKEATDQRDHYKTDWHRYNLKRKVAELAPVSEKAFKDRMVKHEEQRKVLNGETKSPTFYCAIFKKSFATEKAYENHIKSKKYLKAAKAFESKPNREEIELNRKNRQISQTQDVEMESDGEEIEEVDSDEWDEEFDEEDKIPVTDCLFCGNQSKSMEKNLLHMSENHSFFIPDLEFCTDLHGLMEYLGAKVGQGKMCLWCNDKGKAFRSLDAVRKHMVDKGHCKMAFAGGDAIAEYADFYDYSKTYPDGEDEDPDMEVDTNAIDDSGYELVLPSGAKIGHRSLMKYYKQSLNPDRQVVVRKPTDKILDHYKVHGFSGLTMKEAKKRAKDVQYFRKHQQKYYMKLGTKANKLQHHFLDPYAHVG